MNKVVMKAFTDIEQSKKLAEILPIKSADMAWYPSYAKDGYSIRILTDAYPLDIIGEAHDEIPAWSLAALRNCLPSGISIDDILYVFESHNTFDNMWVYEYKFEDISAPLYSKSSNEIDACYEMILKLDEQKLL